jgi:hypothetical protein
MSSCAERDELRAERVGDHLMEPIHVDKAVVDHRLHERFAVEIRFLENVVCLRALQDVLLDEEIGDLGVDHRKMSPAVWKVGGALVPRRRCGRTPIGALRPLPHCCEDAFISSRLRA